MSDFFEKLKMKLSDKKMASVAFALGLGGMMLIAFSSFSSETDKNEISEASIVESSDFQNVSDKYALEKKKELEDLLKSVEGVGEVRVMVNVSCSEEYVYAIFESSSENISQDSTESQYSYEYFTYESQNDTNPLMTKIISPKISSCVVACEGADNAVVRESVYMAVSAALGISFGDIYVAKLS